MIAAFFGYLIDSFMYFLVPGFAIEFSEYASVGELLMTLWLLIKGVNVEQWKKRALEAA